MKLKTPEPRFMPPNSSQKWIKFSPSSGGGIQPPPALLASRLNGRGASKNENLIDYFRLGGWAYVYFVHVPSRKGQLMKKTILTALLCATIGGCAPVLAKDFASDKLIDAIAMVESSGKATAIGDGGKARGMFQMWRGAWEDARKINPAIGDYETGSIDAKRSRIAAKTYLNLLASRIEKATGKEPTPGHIYAAYNLGFAGFKKRGFDLANTPSTTQRAVKKLKGLL